MLLSSCVLCCSPRTLGCLRSGMHLRAWRRVRRCCVLCVTVVISVCLSMRVCVVLCGVMSNARNEQLELVDQ